MAKFQHNKVAFIVLVAAFLSMQWAPTHIHLTGHHDHGGSHHQHEAHAHQSITQYDNANHSNFQIDKHDINVVEIDQQCNTKSGNYLDDQFIASTPSDFHLSFSALKSTVKSTALINSKQRYVDFITIYGRAPPRIS